MSTQQEKEGQAPNLERKTELHNLLIDLIHDEEESVREFTRALVKIFTPERADLPDDELVFQFVETLCGRNNQEYMKFAKAQYARVKEILRAIDEQKNKTTYTDTPAEKQTTSEITAKQTVFKLCDYTKLDLDFHTKEGGKRALNFRLDRTGESTDQAEICFNTEGKNRTCFNRDGYSFPLRGDATDLEESYALSGHGEFLFLGLKNVRVFALQYSNTKAGFEGYFTVYDEAGEPIQTLTLFE